jgi:hypothetical protein
MIFHPTCYQPMTCVSTMSYLDDSPHLVCVVLISKTCTILPNLKISKGLEFLLSDTKIMNTCSFSIHFKKINVCSKVFVECKIILWWAQRGFFFFFFFFFVFSVNNTNLWGISKKIKRACIEGFRYLDASDSQNPRCYGDTNFIT